MWLLFWINNFYDNIIWDPTHPSPKPKFRSTHPPATTQTHTQINPSIHHQQKLKSPLATTTTSQNNHNRHHNNQPHYQPQNPQPINTNKSISITHHLQFTSMKTYPQTPHTPLHFSHATTTLSLIPGPWAA